MQINECLASAGDYDKSVDYSMKQETARALQAGRRIAQCMVKCALTLSQPIADRNS